MSMPIKWENVPKSQVVELKKALQGYIILISNHEKTVISLGFEVKTPIDSLAFNFAIFTANYEALIKLGQHLEQIHQNKLTEFTNQINGKF